MDDLKKLEPLFKKLDKKHEYEYLIFKLYIQNNGFYLTEDQLKIVYENYIKNRE